jgi:predicted Fe-Mo cluster-binding NifX family protein
LYIEKHIIKKGNFMVAIPLNQQHSTILSDLYGNAPYFALLNTDTGVFRVIENGVKGKGPKSADFLKGYGVDSTIYYHMGEGVYKSFVENSMDVFTADHQYLTIDEIYLEFYDNKTHKLDETNYEKLLDPGSAGECKCGCETK